MHQDISSDLVDEFPFKRIGWLYNSVRFVAAFTVYSVFNINVYGLENLACLKDEPGIILPRHESYHDGPVEDIIIKKALKRPARFEMKSHFSYNFPNPLKFYDPLKFHDLKFRISSRPFQYAGAVRVMRDKELRIFPKDERSYMLTEQERTRVMLEEGELRGQRYVDAVRTKLINSGEVVVIHPEGKCDKVPFAPRKDILKRLTRLKTTKDPVFVPLDIRYLEGELGSEVYVRVGPPLQTKDADELYEHLMMYIPATYDARIPAKLQTHFQNL